MSARASGPVALVLGAGPRLGEALARRFGRDGYRVLLAARDDERLSQLAERLRADDIAASGVSVDVSDPGLLATTVRGLVQRTGRLDVVHHNVSIWRDATSLQLTPDALQADLAGGALSLLAVARVAAPVMIAAGGGTILATGSSAADSPSPGAASLGVQKAALRALVQALDMDLRPQGVHCATVTVNGVLAPQGTVDPEQVADVFADLVAETPGPPKNWRTVVPFPG